VDLSPRERALCEFAVKLTHLAAEVEQADIDALRAQGLHDAAAAWLTQAREADSR
jgi:alkylhydroperoxidase family enzyme